MFVSVIVWRFKPGGGPGVEGAIRDRILPVPRGVTGLRHLYAASVQGTPDAWLSVLVYDSKAHADQGLATLSQATHDALGDNIVGMERHAGDAVIAERFG